MFIVYKVDYDSLGRPIEYSLDTDIMTNEDYSKYVNYKNELNILKRKREELGVSRVNLVLGFDLSKRISFITKEMNKIVSNYI